MNEELTLLVLVFGAINISVLTAFIIYKTVSSVRQRKRQNEVTHYGDSAEEKVEKYLKKSFPRGVIMREVYLKTPTGLTEIDTLFVCNRGIFIIEVKSHNGHIITEGNHWTQRWREKVVRFHNPLKQNEVHRAALETVFRKRQSLASLPIYSVVVFTSRSVSFSKSVRGVIKLDSLYNFIKRKAPDRRMTRETVKRVESFVRLNMETSKLRQSKHKKRIRQSNAKKRAYRINYRQ